MLPTEKEADSGAPACAASPGSAGASARIPPWSSAAPWALSLSKGPRALAPLLRAAEILHAGNGAVFGLGKVEVETLQRRDLSLW